MGCFVKQNSDGCADGQYSAGRFVGRRPYAQKAFCQQEGKNENRLKGWFLPAGKGTVSFWKNNF
jgi:hypothetical protein